MDEKNKLLQSLEQQTLRMRLQTSVKYVKGVKYVNRWYND